MGRPRQRDRHLPPRMRRQGRVWYWVGPVDGRQRWIRLSDDWQEALRLYLDREGPLERGTTVADAMTAYLRDVLPTLAASTQRDYRRILSPSGPAQEGRERVPTLRDVFGPARLVAVTSGDVAVYLHRRGAKIAANRERAVLSSVFGYAMRLGWCQANPCLGVPRNPERPREREVTPAEVAAFRGHCGPLLRAYLDVRLLTGLRQGEILDLRRADLQDDGIHVDRPTKRGRRRIIGWSQALRLAVAAALALPPAVRPEGTIQRTYLWPARGRRPLSVEGFRSLWGRAMRAYVAAGGERFHEHDLRAMVADRVDSEAHAAELLGHQSQAMARRVYRRRKRLVLPAE